jgi:hypothetical protein
MAITRRQPAHVLATTWGVAALLSLYGAQEIRDGLRTAAWAGDGSLPVAAADRLLAVAEATRLAGLRRALEGSPAAAQTVASERATGGGPPADPGPAPAAPLKVTGPQQQAATIGRVLLVGASTMQFHLGVELERQLRARYPTLVVERLGKLSTGLTRPDVFDWPAKLRELVAAGKPDLVVANFGGNDAQAMVLDGGAVAKFGRPEWDASYRRRVEQVVNIGRSAGATVVLLGMSTTRDPALSRRMGRINRLTEAAGREAGGRYLSIWDLGADARGAYQEVASVDGVAVRTRLADGKHFSRAGAAYAAREIVQRLAQMVPLPGQRL